MTLSEIVSMLEESDIPIAYRSFDVDNAPAPPFICYLFPNNNPEFADDSNYAKIEELDIELYTDQKDFELENKIEAILNKYELPFTREETWINEERMQMTIFITEVLIDGEQDPVRT